MTHFSVRLKLLLGFLTLVLLVFGSSLYTLYNIRIIKNDVDNFGLATSRGRALLEIKSLSTNINNLTSRFDTRASKETIDAQKDELLAMLDEVDRWQRKYQSALSSKEKSNLDIKKLQMIHSTIVLTTSDYLQEKADSTTKNKLDEAVKSLGSFVKNATLVESSIIESTKAQTLTLTKRIYLISLVTNVFVLILAIMISLILTHIIATPIIKLKKFTEKISDTNLEERAAIDSRDEIGDLAHTLNSMLDTLAKTRSQLIEASRIAGASEVATSVLHNVGNVLNSINVSVSELVDLEKKRGESNLPQILEMIEMHLDNLSDYLKNDEKGKLVIDYLKAFDADYHAHHQISLNEINDLLKNLQHVNNIIGMQQSLGKVAVVYEMVSIPELLDDAITLSVKTVDPNDSKINIIKDYAEVPKLSTIKSKVQQILINLIKNAVESFPRDQVDKKIIIKIRNVSDHLVIEIIDNGTGIQSQQLKEIFRFGITTKPQGHGYGLHNSALFVSELGGKIKAESQGINTGATFIIELPYHQ